MGATAVRTTALGIVIALIAVACTPSATDAPTSTTAEPTSTTSTEPPVDAEGALLPPQRADASGVASDALVAIDGFVPDPEPSLISEDLLIAMQDWLLPDLAEGEASLIYRRTSTESSVSVLSVIPSLQWRGDPGFVEDLIEAISGTEAFSLSDGIFNTVAPSGAHLYLSSTGDGFLMASAIDSGDAIAYLEQRLDVTEVNDAWQTGSCLYLRDDEALPYAPFPPDVVVPCDAAHNAEVLIGLTNGTDLTDYDEEAIAYERNYTCDKAYESTFGSQRSHAPSLITYMPDVDEWDRGDRYLACVVIIDRNEGRELLAGPMSEGDDLAFEPAIGKCIASGLPADTTACVVVHAYQYLGDVDVVADTWPTLDGSAFADACAPLLDDLPPGPAVVDVFPVGLGAYAFENGARTVRCMAFASVDGFLTEVIGPFTGVWRIIGDGGLAA